ncbi:hypothetical protein K438DRAFT_912739 [Mycena galopus ATCC 62051]|nr:hypothetical protein K438DRAFT_912739 [Mycena galopus ATCC 62051]
MPRCYMNCEIGNNGPDDDKSYSSYNLVYHPQTTQLDGGRPQWHPVEVTVGMGINVIPRKEPLPTISFVNRHQVLIWVSDPASNSRIRGIVVLLNNYLNDIQTPDELCVLEKETIDLDKKPSPKTQQGQQKSGTISLSVAQVEKEPSNKFRAVTTSLTKLGRRPAVAPLPDITPHEYLARGWHANHNEWRQVLWPALDKDFRAADVFGGKSPFWTIQCPWNQAHTTTGAGTTP